MKQNDESGKSGVRGPMRIVFTIIIVGIITIVAVSFFLNRGPQGPDTELTPQTQTQTPAPEGP